MEFDEIKKIWDAQNNQPLYVLDEKALHNRIQSKMKGVLALANVSEWGLIIINLLTAGILLTLNFSTHAANVFMYIEAAWMFATVAYIVSHRSRRVSSSRRFDRSIHGDLDHAISIATYHVRLVRMMNWNSLPLGAIMIFSGWEAGQLLKAAAVILVSYGFSFYVGVKQDRANVRRRRELQVLKEKLEAAC